ncbi:MAG TPA: hypothetical protein EYN79_01535 [Planctomycetes bacterium]|nr:hypothetical protein [Planctomycetota bacterium]
MNPSPSWRSSTTSRRDGVTSPRQRCSPSPLGCRSPSASCTAPSPSTTTSASRSRSAPLTSSCARVPPAACTTSICSRRSWRTPISESHTPAPCAESPVPGVATMLPPIFIGDKVFTHAAPGALDGISPAEMPLPPETGVEECLFENIRDGIESLADYKKKGGYASLEMAATDPEKLIAEIRESGLTGRGGAGFPTGVKWKAVRDESRGPKAIICNADEGEVGCFKDRLLLARNPHGVIEGMICSALVTGAEVGIVYLRWEYPEILHSLQLAIDEARSAGFIGDDVAGSGHAFNLVIRRGAGAYICGEETSLLNSLEGKHPFPMDKPPFPTTHGLFRLPTVINNVETFAAVPPIAARGGEWYRSLGIGENAGTRIFSVSGDVQRPGNYELPVGTPLRTLLEEHAGGARDGHTIKGVTMAGISGGFVGAEDLDVPLDPPSLEALGGMLGAGGIVVYDDSRCMIQAARASMHFLAHESCGKCFPCRIGTTRATEILDEMCSHAAGNGEVRLDPLGEMTDIDEVLAETSACGLGLAAPFVTRMLRKYWPEEVEAHLAGRCPSGACQGNVR